MQLTAEERLEAIKSGLPSKGLIRSEAKRLAYVMPHIEAAMSEGISQPVIYRTLKEGGLELAESSFKSTLSRVRKRQQGTEIHSDTADQAQTASAPEEDVKKEGPTSAKSKSAQDSWNDMQARMEAKGSFRDHSERSKNRK